MNKAFLIGVLAAAGAVAWTATPGSASAASITKGVFAPGHQGNAVASLDRAHKADCNALSRSCDATPADRASIGSDKASRLLATTNATVIDKGRVSPLTFGDVQLVEYDDELDETDDSLEADDAESHEMDGDTEVL